MKIENNRDRTRKTAFFDLDSDFDEFRAAFFDLAFSITTSYRNGGNFRSENMCVCVFSSHPFWTSSSLDVPAGVTQEEGHTGFLIHLPSAVRALIFVARRIQPFLSLVDREVEFCVLTN